MTGGVIFFLSHTLKWERFETVMFEIEPIRGFQCYHNKTGSYLKSFPDDKTVFYAIYLTLFMFVLYAIFIKDKTGL